MLSIILAIAAPSFISISVTVWLSVVLYNYIKSGTYKDDVCTEWNNSKQSWR